MTRISAAASLVVAIVVFSAPRPATAAECRVSGAVAGEVVVSTSDDGFWRVKADVVSECAGVDCVRVRLDASRDGAPQPFKVSFGAPLADAVGTWRTDLGFSKGLVQTWKKAASLSSSLATDAPVASYYGTDSGNRLTVACSESVRKVAIVTGIDEERRGLGFSAELFTEPEAPVRSYEVEFRVDRRGVFYADAVRDAFGWCVARLGGEADGGVPPGAFEPLYSTWYSYKQGVSAASVERECEAAAALGMKTVIVDDGWQTDGRGCGYSSCGDWRPSAAKFPDFKAHVAKVQSMGMKYMLWYSVPFVGEDSAAYERFKDKFLYRTWGAGVLDPRFPEVREHLAGIYVAALRDWGVDGMKLDFIDSFKFEDGKDPAVADGYAGRDLKSLPAAVDRLLGDIMARLRAVRPDVLLEFRQSYVGPAMRRRGNMFRVFDCAYGAAQNRVSSIDLRLSSGPAAVHSDMIIWPPDADGDGVSAQLLNALFSVPQVSVRAGSLTAPQREALGRWMAFWREHRDTLMRGELRPMRPDLGYPVVYAFGKGEQVVAVYDEGQAVSVDSARGTAYVVNATGASSLTVCVDGAPRRMEVRPFGLLVVRP